MTQEFAVLLILALVILTSNIPFLSHRSLVLLRLKAPKSFVHCFAELVVLQLIVLVLAMSFESFFGQIASQNWQFFVAFWLVGLTCAFPGFVWRFLWLRSASR